MEPFLKWAGGKRWLTAKSNELFPTNMNRYFEPFLGGGAIFFYLEPPAGRLSDINGDLINSYQVIKNDWQNLYDILTGYNALHSNEYYYRIRSSNPENELMQAARFIYLNRTCWNGLYRVNKRGGFNVPIGSKTNVIMDSDNFQELSNLLANTDIESCDFEQTIDQTQVGDFLFIDPPYTVKHNLNGFIKYNETLFSWDDQIRLRDSIIRAIERGVQVLVLNADHSSIKELYHGMGEFSILNRASVIAGNSNARGVYSELAIKCWI